MNYNLLEKEDLSYLGLDMSMYKLYKKYSVTTKDIQLLWTRLFKDVPFTLELLVTFKRQLPANIKLMNNGRCYHIVFYTKNNLYYAKIREKSKLKQELLITAMFANHKLVYLHTGQPSVVRQGFYLQFTKFNDTYTCTYYNAQGKILYMLESRTSFSLLRINFIIPQNSSCTYEFADNKLVTFNNSAQHVSLQFYSFHNSTKYKIRKIQYKDKVIYYSPHGVIREEQTKENAIIYVNEYYVTGQLKCKYSYDEASNMLIGKYLQYNKLGETIKTKNFPQIK